MSTIQVASSPSPSSLGLDAVRLLKVPEVAEVLRVSVNMVYDLIKRGSLQAFQLNEGKTKIRIRPSAVEDFLAERVIEPDLAG